MTEEIFRRDGYVFEFEAVVVSVEGDLVELDSTAFYPGGGGQACDTGTIRQTPVTETLYEGGRIVHRAPGSGLAPGDRVWCSVDWDRRYGLMQGHTGEHLLFCALKRQDPELEVVKISITPDDSHVIVDHDPGWDAVHDAVAFANSAIRDNLSIAKSVMSRNDPDLEKVRIKLDRIAEDEDVSVVSIGDIDVSACSGVHVMETGELEMIVVDRKVSAGKNGTAIHFKVGRKAADAALGLASVCLRAVDEAGTKPEDMVRWVANAKRDLDACRSAAKALVKESLKALKPRIVNGTPVFSGVFPGAERSVLTDFAESVRSKGGVAVLLSTDGQASVVLASGTDRTDCGRILADVLGEFGGRGGGKKDFAQGGAADAGSAEALMERLLSETERSLS
ncbi:MAG: alanyl-tRNA editing protein [Candidatus Methanoplasma sp.]|jgi:alanyl-tRNA synthetase|nr:alanyl-tRNA editing protein [Candidatus Methanoplasma sp.]